MTEAERRQAIASWYENRLGRRPEAGDVDYWYTNTNSHADFIREVETGAASGEFKFVQWWHDNIDDTLASNMNEGSNRKYWWDQIKDNGYENTIATVEATARANDDWKGDDSSNETTTGTGTNRTSLLAALSAQNAMWLDTFYKDNISSDLTLEVANDWLSQTKPGTNEKYTVEELKGVIEGTARSENTWKGGESASSSTSSTNIASTNIASTNIAGTNTAITNTQLRALIKDAYSMFLNPTTGAPRVPEETDYAYWAASGITTKQGFVNAFRNTDGYKQAARKSVDSGESSAWKLNEAEETYLGANPNIKIANLNLHSTGDQSSDIVQRDLGYNEYQTYHKLNHDYATVFGRTIDAEGYDYYTDPNGAHNFLTKPYNSTTVKDNLRLSTEYDARLRGQDNLYLPKQELDHAVMRIGAEKVLEYAKYQGFDADDNYLGKKNWAEETGLTLQSDAIKLTTGKHKDGSIDKQLTSYVTLADKSNMMAGYYAMDETHLSELTTAFVNTLYGNEGKGITLTDGTAEFKEGVHVNATWGLDIKRDWSTITTSAYADGFSDEEKQQWYNHAMYGDVDWAFYQTDNTYKALWTTAVAEALADNSIVWDKLKGSDDYIGVTSVEEIRFLNKLATSAQISELQSEAEATWDPNYEPPDTSVDIDYGSWANKQGYVPNFVYTKPQYDSSGWYTTGVDVLDMDATYTTFAPSAYWDSNKGEIVRQGDDDDDMITSANPNAVFPSGQVRKRGANTTMWADHPKQHLDVPNLDAPIGDWPGKHLPPTDPRTETRLDKKTLYKPVAASTFTEALKAKIDKDLPTGKSVSIPYNLPDTPSQTTVPENIPTLQPAVTITGQ